MSANSTPSTIGASPKAARCQPVGSKRCSRSTRTSNGVLAGGARSTSSKSDGSPSTAKPGATAEPDPDVEPEPESDVEPEPESDVEPESESDVEPESEPKPGPAGVSGAESADRALSPSAAAPLGSAGDATLTTRDAGLLGLGAPRTRTFVSVNRPAPLSTRRRATEGERRRAAVALDAIRGGGHLTGDFGL